MDAHGNRLDSISALTTILYSGELLDVLTGLYNNRARYYDLATGRFNRLDPFGDKMRDKMGIGPIFDTMGYFR